MEWRSRAVGDRDDLRLVAERSLHVTLVFLGGVPEREVQAVEAAVGSAVGGLPPPRLRVAGVRGVPPKRPRLFALDLEDSGGRAGDVQTALSDALSAGGWYEPERRAFWPHVTFARVKRGSAARVPPVDLPPPADPFTASQVTLFRSHLSPRGSSYEALARVRLRRG